MADNRLAEAIDVIAKQAIKAATDDSPGYTVSWENYPEIGENDWARVVERVDEITALIAPDQPEFEAAYDYLMDRAKGVEA